MNKILIVEDEVVVARDIRQQLKLLKYEPVASATTGEEALLLAERLHPDLVLMDIQLAGDMDGIVAARTIRERFDIPVVFLTAFAGDETVQRAKLAQPFGYIVKPLEERDLKITIAIALCKHQADKSIRSAHKQLLDKEEQFKKLARQSRTCTWEINPDGLYTYCCQVFSDLMGYREDEIVGRMHFFDLHPERGRKEFKRAALETIARQDNFLDLENPIQTREGLIIWVSTTAIPVLDNDGKLLGYSGSDTDITKRKQAQETHDILHRQLMQSQKMEVVGQLAGGVAHDFNNILSVMLMHLHLNKTNNNAEFLTELEIQVARASNLTRQLLLFSRKEALHIESIQLNEVIRNLIKMLHRLIEENITIDLQLEPQLPLIEADAGMMEQVLTNLSINARDAMPRGGILFIKTEHVQWTDSHPQTGTPRSPGNYVRLTVSDTGSGMDESVVARMFEPFFTTKEAGKGTGLGLATVHGIVQQHGGWIGVASKMGSGSAFTIHLPVSKSSVAQTLPVRSNNSPLVGGFETILIAEDDFNLRSMTSKTLRQYGYEVMEAADGQQALAMGKEKSGEIHLLLADMVMPGGLSGLELAARLSEIQPSLKVLLITGYALEVAVKKADSGENYALLRKPCGVPALLAAVRHCLDGKAGTNEEK